MGRGLGRFSDADDPMRYLRICPALVRCHRCDGLATVRCGRAYCGGCGYNGVPAPDRVMRTANRISTRCGDCGQWLTWWGTRNASGVRLMRCRCGWSRRFDMTAVPMGSLYRGQEPRTGLPLWLRSEFRGRLLWAVNEAHLDFLERYVAAGVREQSPGNSTLASRLPAWIKSAKHRPALLRTLGRMRATLPDSPRP
ncbi:hypothetical protein LX16_2721 [Stackebrandtia albiflava]|uniref:Uncharacterized protein n=1 Tax=Stackebrandtia albiflava TaxID=406432 RepID=A0A562V274_9ACTN|nr:hypothetical protein [Stackebrandtia albiflava]TWJ11978.1 hypothetical protein LX16_2721 [Stackebrandtia albiflava]